MTCASRPRPAHRRRTTKGGGTGPVQFEEAARTCARFAIRGSHMSLGIQLKNIQTVSGFRPFSKIISTSLFTAAIVALAPAAQAAEGDTAAAAAIAPVAKQAQGGLFESPTAKPDAADPQFKSMFLSWKTLDQGKAAAPGTVSIPSQRPVTDIAFSSNFGVRSDPFRHTRAMHAGVDIPGPVGTPVYATADGLVGRAQRAGGYGNLVELEHGQGIQTRYGHLSAIVAQPGTRVKRGDLIGLMGSTGRSTGSHLHYEVRLDGHAVNPVPFLESADYVLAAQAQTGNTQLALGGPAGK